MRETGIRVGTVAITVANQDQAVDFYVRTLGFEIRRDVPLERLRWIEVAPPGAATTIALVTEGVPAGIRLFVQDADAARAELSQRGADTDPAVLRMDGAPGMFGVRDPDGNNLILVGAS